MDWSYLHGERWCLNLVVKDSLKFINTIDRTLLQISHANFIPVQWDLHSESCLVLPDKYQAKIKTSFVSHSMLAFIFFATSYSIYIFYLDFFKNQNEIAYFDVKLDKNFVNNWEYFPEISFLVWRTINSSAFEHWNIPHISLQCLNKV